MAEVNEALMGSDESLNEADAAKLIAIVMTNHFSESTLLVITFLNTRLFNLEQAHERSPLTLPWQ